MPFSLIMSTLYIALITSVYIVYRLRVRSSQTRKNAGAETSMSLDLEGSLSEPAQQLRAKLMSALPESIISPENAASFKQSTNSYWDQKACEVRPSCVVRPRDVQELSRTVKILKSEFDQRRKESKISESILEGIFAVRGGGHSPVAGASSIKGGSLIDMSLFNEVTPSDDGKSVIIGAGCKWIQVSKVLEAKGLAAVGGRNSAVGVGGLILGGGLSFFSPRFGFVCSNIIQYEIVLANGSIAIASKTQNSDLWRALKGGSNNFGIVTRFTAHTFPSTDIWSGFLYIFPFEAPKVLSAFHEFVDRVVINDEGKTHDEYAAGPLACFTYLQQLGIQAIAVNLVHTKPPMGDKGWATCWQSSAFPKLWRFWSTCSVKSLSSATDENDKETLEATHKAYRDAITSIRKHNIKAMSWTLVLQPLLPDWARKGDPNPLGLSSSTNESLVNVSFTVNWALAKDDGLVQSLTRMAIEQIDRFAVGKGTAHRYRYLNYCGSWQKPFEGYGEKNVDFLRAVSRTYDPEGLFQYGCVGGFKLK
ncbi:Glucooligosaccharide oxidase [Cucurbitaria berberidis CBS 394.84]|uniref:Glucooligosaccharide oxidase n=1 Tax=Cucurbitaria berberidis CBS 394.84 TaxID=1168544 RepID=A0A9P4GG67_9PLEO|nr:Glucooligosaccharide oxidase [Cucurbitaria berberidis CBS 394.84]KAF1845473.1 Glucooligosaccharide oxidase [Cucurbitaria berberidis CBS 394.84]